MLLTRCLVCSLNFRTIKSRAAPTVKIVTRYNPIPRPLRRSPRRMPARVTVRQRPFSHRLDLRQQMVLGGVTVPDDDSDFHAFDSLVLGFADCRPKAPRLTAR